MPGAGGIRAWWIEFSVVEWMEKVSDEQYQG